MSAIRLLARATAATGLALGATVVLAGPAAAADASCQLSRLPSRMSAGGNGAQIAGRVQSTNREILDVVQVVWRIRASDLDADDVSLSGISLSEEDNEVRGTEQLNSVGPFGRTVAHTMRFDSTAPAGRVQVTMAAFIRDNGDLKEACSTRVTTSIQGVRGTPTPEQTLEATPLETGLADASESPPAAAAPAAPQAPDNDSALWPMYLLGLLLVAGGGGVVALLLLRRPRDDEAPVYEPVYAGGYAGPAPGYGAPAGGSPGAPGYGAPGYGAQLADAGFGGQPAYRGYEAPPPHPTHVLPPPVDPYGAPPSDAPTAFIPVVSDDEDRHPGGRHRGGGL